MAFAELLHGAIAGLGTNDDELMRIVAWRSEVRNEIKPNAYTPLGRHEGNQELLSHPLQQGSH